MKYQRCWQDQLLRLTLTTCFYSIIHYTGGQVGPFKGDFLFGWDKLGDLNSNPSVSSPFTYSFTVLLLFLCQSSFAHYFFYLSFFLLGIDRLIL